MKKTINWAAASGAVSLLFVVAVLTPVIASAQRNNAANRGRPAEVTQRVEERKAAAMEKVKEKRKAAKLKSQEARKNACEKRSANLHRHMDRMATQANKHVATFDSIYERVQGFYDSGQLTVDNYDELTAAVDEAQLNAQNEAAALGELSVELDCENPDVAASVGAFRDSVNVSRQALKDYRAELVELISSLRSAADEENAESSDTDTEDAGIENEQEQETEEAEAPETETEEEV